MAGLGLIFSLYGWSSLGFRLAFSSYSDLGWDDFQSDVKISVTLILLGALGLVFAPSWRRKAPSKAGTGG
jgi:hypothetical protein